MFSSGACIIGDLRGKDGPLNHILAGVLSGVSIAAYSEYSATVDGIVHQSCSLEPQRFNLSLTQVANSNDLRFESDSG